MTYDLAQLRAFIAVVEAGSIGRAAQQLHMSQPTLSRAIKRLEETVGELLFERHTTGMQLTVFGSALLPHARVLHREEEVAREEVNAMRGLATGTLRVGTTASTSASVFPRILASYLQRWPNLQVEAVEGVHEHLAQALANYEVDLIFTTDARDTTEIVSIKDCRWMEDVSVVVGAAHPLAQKADAATLEDLRDARWALVPLGTEPRERLLHLFAAQGLDPPRTLVSTTSIQLLKRMVIHANLVTWLTTPMYEAERQAGTMVPITVQGLSETRRFTVFRRRQGVLPRPASSMVEEIRAHLQIDPAAKSRV